MSKNGHATPCESDWWRCSVRHSQARGRDGQPKRSNVAKSRFGPEFKLRTVEPTEVDLFQVLQVLKQFNLWGECCDMLWSLHKQTLLFWSLWRCYKNSSFRRRESGPIISLRKSESHPRKIRPSDLLYQQVPLVTWYTCAYTHIEYFIQIAYLFDVFVQHFSVPSSLNRHKQHCSSGTKNTFCLWTWRLQFSA
jgi:hypothetical protein